VELRLDGKVAFVTGADSGIGQGIARAFAESGADVAINYYRDEAGAMETVALVEAADRQALVLQGDVGAPADVERLFAAIDGRFGRIDIMVNNAGIGTEGQLHEMPLEAWSRVLATNLHGTFLCSGQAARRMLAQGDGGRIINITSVHEEACATGGGAYNVSKAGIRNLTRTQAAELAPHGITVNNIAPGMILTPMNDRALEDEAYLREAEAQIPVRRAGLPADIANMATFLASDAASYCTGATYFVDGGWMLTQPPV
jgi:glucose 1-dehydrogenase